MNIMGCYSYSTVKYSYSAVEKIKGPISAAFCFLFFWDCGGERGDC